MSRAASRILDAPRFGPDEQGLKPALDALGGEVVRLRARDGMRLHARWLPSVDAGSGARPASAVTPDDAGRWVPDPYEAILLLHGWTGSVAPDLVALGPTLRQDRRRPRPRLPRAWRLRRRADHVRAARDRGRRRCPGLARRARHPAGRAQSARRWAGRSRSTRSSPSATGPSRPPTTTRSARPRRSTPPRPRIVGVVAEAVPADLRVPIANRIPWRIGGPLRRLARRADVRAPRPPRSGGDLRAMEPGRVVALVEPVPLLLVHGGADRTVPPKEGRRLAALAGPHAEHWVVAGAGHGTARAADPAGWDDRVSRFLRQAFSQARDAGL